ncbi:MAG TPA: response regulator transcription factor [Kineosporiaceae bacterium]|nr:response regulator transcription factor [Kineosporiaceae bacterium]
MTVRVVLADDQALVRGGFRMILETLGGGGIEVVGEAADGARAVEVVAQTRPDVVLMDVRMPILDGVEATRRIVASESDSRIVILTTYDLDEYVLASIRAGASGFLLKDVRPQELVDAVHVIARGDALLAPAVTRRLLDRLVAVQPDQPTPPDLAVLTDRELQVLRLVAEALSNVEIGARLYLAEATVKSHVSSILRKLALRDRVQAVALAYDVGLLRPRSS